MIRPTMRRALAHLPSALLLLLASQVRSAPNPHPYNFIDNYHDPAPLPQNGPPASAHASRDKNLLPAQICGIVAGYVATVLIWGILLLTVGRRMRRKTESSPKTLDLELVTRRPQNAILSPSSPIGSSKSVSSWRKKFFRKEKDIETGGDGDDDSPIAISPVVHSPGSFDQRVLEDNKAKAQAEMERLYAAVMDHDRKKSIASNASDSEHHRPSAISTHQPVSHSNPSSPVRSVYPPYHASGPPTAPLPRDRPPSSPRSVLSKKSQSSTSSKRFNLKNLRISGPIAKYPGESAPEERTPLSPRHYGDPGAPPSPPTQATSPTTPADLQEAYAYEELDTVRPLPRSAPHRSGSSAAASPITASRPTITISKSAASSQNELPLRGYAEPLKSPDLRTTVLNRRVDHLGMTTPKTGVPYTPYSPYMPFTPVTPVTPHLVTKKERKAAKKWEGRGRVGSGGDGGMVQSPKDIFGDAW